MRCASCLVEAGQRSLGRRERQVGRDNRLPVLFGGGSGQSGLGDGQPVDVVAASPEVTAHRIGEQPRGFLRAVQRRPGDGCDEIRPLGVQPSLRVGVRGHRADVRHGGREVRRQGQPLHVRVQDARSGVGRQQVVVAQPVRRCGPVGRTDLLLRALGGVQAQQVVHGEPAWRVLVEQMGGSQIGEQPPGLRRAAAGQRRGGAGAQVAARVQAGQLEHALCIRAQRCVRQVERSSDRGLLVAADFQDGQAVALAQLGCKLTDRLPGMPGQLRGGDAQRERQPGAQCSELGDRLRFGTRPGSPEKVGEQGERLVHGKHAELKVVRAVARHQSGESVPAGDHGQATCAAGQERAYLAR